MLKVGLTGGIGSGKTTVSDLFKSLAIDVIDTDVIAHELINTNHEVSQEVVAAFGKGIIAANGVIDRKKLAAFVFENKANKQKLENILHPKIRREVNHKISKLSSQKTPPAYIIIVIPLLFETDFHYLIDNVLVVTADEETRVARVIQRDSRSEDEIRSIIANQVKDTVRHAAADHIIYNNGSIAELEPQINHLHAKYLRLAKT